ncbi:Ig-like domain-containing protein [Flavobacterium sp.]|uniref:Ig-like domain-containing protein n=1 Tax=Flavobacterium sp. TaxID=239 RepID=UPI00262F0DD9|nr:Ig-like domain-containing protein [Flavobacterium sp.]MDD3003778.1 Ig-like domain-containing protein [Flavobacterium sp.]
MKKILFLLFIGILPFIGFGQTDLVKWGLTNNGNVTFAQNYLTASNLSYVGSSADYTVDGLGIANFNNSGLEHYRFFQITIKPTAGNALNLSKLAFEQAQSSGGASHYGIKYYVSNNGSIPSDYDFFTNFSTWLVTDESISGNPIKNINLNIPTLTSSQTLIIRFYARGASNYNAYGWKIKANTLKIVGSNPNVISTPVANSDVASTSKNISTTINVLSNDTHSALSAITVTQNTTNGIVQVNGVNNITYIPNENFTGNDSFKYKLVDNIGTSNVATVTISVTEAVAVDLVRWNGANIQPNAFLIVNNGTISANPVSGNFVTDIYESPFSGFRGSNYNTSSTTPDYNNFMEFAIKANGNNVIDLTEFKFIYARGAGGPQKFEVRYSTDSSIGTAIGGITNVTTSPEVKTIDLAGMSVAAGQTFYIRIYPFDRENIYWNGGTFHIQHGATSNGAVVNETGPTFKGIVNVPNITVWTSQNNWSNGVPSIEKDAIIEGNYTLMPNEVLKVKNLTINPSAKVTVAKNAVLVVQKDVTVLSNPGTTSPQLVVENDGSFVQVDGDANYIGSDDSFFMNRKTQPLYRLDYTYWSSPIKASSGYTLKKLSPLTLASKFYKWNDAWVNVNANTEVMVPGKGYIVRAPQNFDIQGQAGAVAKIDSVVFRGVPNNGLVKIAVNGDQKWNLIGNPYPSALSIDEFYHNLNNRSKLYGTVYVWTHNTPIGAVGGSGYYSYSPNDYAAYNQTGGTATSLVLPTNSQQNLPLGYIASGQSFFVQGITGGEAEFDNTMRVTQSGLNNQFFKPTPTETVENWQNTGKHRVWLNITSMQNDFNQALVGYIENATNDLDWGYDGVVFSGGSVMLYSVLGDKKLSIQGKALPFSNQDEVPLGYQTSLTGTLKISIDHVDGLFEGQKVYLKDNVTGIVHNLKDSEYTFTTVPGTFNERFVLRYLPQEDLSTNIPVVDANSIVVFNKNNQISIKSAEQTINTVEVYDLQGRVLLSKNNIKAQDFTTQTLQAVNQVVLVKVITEDNAELVKKVMLK